MQLHRITLLATVLMLVGTSRSLLGQGITAGTAQSQRNITTYGAQTEPALIRDAVANLVVALTDEFPVSKARRLPSNGTPLSSEIRVDSQVLGTRGRPALAERQTSGDFIVVWDSGFD